MSNGVMAEQPIETKYGVEALDSYELNKEFPKLAMSSLLQGDHFVEHIKRTLQIGDTYRESEAFLIKHTDDKGNIDLRIKYEPNLLDSGEDVLEDIKEQTRLEYLLRNYAQSYDPKSIVAKQYAEGKAIITFNYSKYGLPQDIDYFRHLKVKLQLQNNTPKQMVIFNDKTFNFGQYKIKQYRQTINFDLQAQGQTLILNKTVDVKGFKGNKKLRTITVVEPVALYQDEQPTTILNLTKLEQVSDPRLLEKSMQLNRTFPLMGDMVRRQGIDLPLPFGVSMAYRSQEMNMPFNDFVINGIRLNDIFSPEGSIGSVNAESFTLRGDVNILPFWNIFAFAGQINVDAVIDAQYTGAPGQSIKDKLNDKLPGLGNKFCQSVSTFCQQSNFDIPLHLEYDLLGIGTTLSIGYKEYFGSVTGSYSQTRLKGNDKWGDGLYTVQPMLGYQLKELRAQLFIGAEYQGIDSRLNGHVKTTDLEFDYDVGVDINNWAYLVGFNKQLGKNYNVTMLYNKGESRNALTLNVGYRF